LLREGRVAEACETLRASLALKRSPGILLNVATCARDEGDLLEAKAGFEAARREAESYPGESERRKLWMNAADEALRQLRPRLAELHLVVPSGAALPASWAARIDGEPLALANGRALQNPGTHRLEVQAEGREPYAREVVLAEGERLQVEVQLALAVPAAEAAPVEPPASEPPAAPAGGSSRVLPTVLAVGGGVITLAGLTAGLLSWQRTNDLESVCPGSACPEGELSEANRLATAADILVGSGLVLGLIGGGWLIFGGESEPEARVEAACWGPSACRARVTLAF